MVSSYEIGNKITTIVTDNASNMTKPFNFSLPGYVENVYQTSPDDDVSDDTDLKPVDTNQSTYFECLPQHSACYANTLQLVVKDGLKDARKPS